MSERFECGDNSALVGYLYGECEPEERTAIAAHVTICAACAAEVAALESTRIQLAEWTPPDAELGFVVSRPQARARPEARRLRPAAAWLRRPLPVWAQAAAAVLLFGAGLSLGIARGTAPFVSPAAGTIASAPAAPQSVSATQLADLERRLRTEIAQIRMTGAQGRGASLPADADLMARVRALIDESEQRQQRELALRTADIVGDFDSQRRLDLAQIQRTFGQIEGVTGAEVREQRQLLNYLMRVSQQP